MGNTLQTIRRRWTRTRACLIVVSAIAFALLWTHAAPEQEHMGVAGIAAVCLAIGGGMALAFAAVPSGVMLPPERHARRLRVPSHAPRTVIAVPARAGPAELQVLRR